MGKLEERKTLKISDSSKNNKPATRKCSIKGVLKNYVKITGKYFCRSLLNKVSGLLRHRYSPVKLEKILRTSPVATSLLSDVVKLKRRRTEDTQFKKESKTK